VRKTNKGILTLAREKKEQLKMTIDTYDGSRCNNKSLVSKYKRL
jgi:hypothetical protein